MVRGRHHQFPLSPENAREIYSHDFEKLFKAADLTKSFERARLADSQLELYWKGVVKDWTEKSRYARNSSRVGKQKAQAMIDAVADPITECSSV